MSTIIIGNLPYFEVGQDWRIFKERLSQWFAANQIVKEKDPSNKDSRRRAVFLSAISDSAYKLVRELIAPKTVNELSYSEILNEIDKYFIPKKSLFAERHSFHNATQENGESFAMWAARIRNLSADCSFGSALDEMLRDRFVLGMQQGAERDKLFMEEAAGMTLSGALDIAMAVHSARQAARQSASASPAAPGTDVYRVTATNKAGRAQCRVCGYNNHSVEQCRFKNYKCKKCGLKGHLKKMCCSENKVNMLLGDDCNGDDGKNP